VLFDVNAQVRESLPLAYQSVLLHWKSMSKWKRLFIEVIKVKYKVRLHCGAQAAARFDYGAQQQTDLLDFVSVYRKSHVFLHCQQG
jgi:hypothetical protein